MISSVRTLIIGLFALFLSAGLIGCAVFSQTASATPSDGMDQKQGLHTHHHHEWMPQGEHADPASDHHGGDSSSCDSCKQTVANRAVTAPDKTDTGAAFPLPVFVIPAALSLDAVAFRPARTDWPPGLDPPLRPSTLTHQKISLLI